MRGATVVPLQPHQILCLSRRKTHMLYPHHIWNLIYNARSNNCPPPTSPNTMPVTQKDSHALSWSHMKPYLQCAEQQLSPSNLTKYYACHAERLTCFILVTYETLFTMHGATGLCLQHHQILYLSHRKTHMLYPHHIWNLIYNARSNRPLPPTSPNIVPVTQKDSYALSSLHMKPHLQCAEQQASPSNITKYCACHAERLTCFILITYETSFTMRRATGLPLQHYQILRLPQKIPFANFLENLWKRMKRHFQCGADPRPIRE